MKNKPVLKICLASGVTIFLLWLAMRYWPFIEKLLGLMGIYLSQPAADVLTIGVCLALIKPMKRMASKNMLGGNYEETS